MLCRSMLKQIPLTHLIMSFVTRRRISLKYAFRVIVLQLAQSIFVLHSVSSGHSTSRCVLYLQQLCTSVVKTAPDFDGCSWLAINVCTLLLFEFLTAFSASPSSPLSYNFAVMSHVKIAYYCCMR